LQEIEQAWLDSVTNTINDQKLWAASQLKLLEERENTLKDSLRIINEILLEQKGKKASTANREKMGEREYLKRQEDKSSADQLIREQPELNSAVNTNIVLVAYHASLMGFKPENYGYINFGDGKGNKYLSKEEFEEYAKKIKFIIEYK